MSIPNEQIRGDDLKISLSSEVIHINHRNAVRLKPLRFWVNCVQVVLLDTRPGSKLKSTPDCFGLLLAFSLYRHSIGLMLAKKLC